MKKIEVFSREQVSPESQIIFDQIQKRLGKVPNMHATIGSSSTALKAFLDFEDILNQGVFSPVEREAIALVVSQVNDCRYCLAAHTLLAKTKGLSGEEIINIRKGSASEKKLNSIIQLAKSIAENKGDAKAVFVQNFFNEGFSQGALMELIGLVTARTFTNYVYAIGNIPIDFPEVETI
ncbi:MAG: carboxymuconolactone decarboxylase family protein [Flavobacterium sp.]|nr:carboxymuconolactone decarboxylase family protein [Flavobacterium sp.]